MFPYKSVPIPKVSSFLSEGIFRSVCSLWSYQLGFPLVFLVCSSVYCHVMLINSLRYSGSHVGLKKEFSCALSFYLSIGWAEWPIQNTRKSQQGHVSLSYPAVTPNCSKYTEPRCQKKVAGDQGWAIRRGKYLLVDICGEGLHSFCHRPAHEQGSCTGHKKQNCDTTKNY